MLLASNTGSVNLLTLLEWGQTTNDILGNEVIHIAFIGNDTNRYYWLTSFV